MDIIHSKNMDNLYESRRLNRDLKRSNAKDELNRLYGNYDDIFSISSLIDAFYKCKKECHGKVLLLTQVPKYHILLPT